MIHNLFEMDTRRISGMRDDQVKYSRENPEKYRSRIRITFGHDISEKMKIGKGALLRIEWNDEDRILKISRSDKGFKVYQKNSHRMFITFNEPEKAKLPHLKKVFTNIIIGGQHELIMDFSMVTDEEK